MKKTDVYELLDKTLNIEAFKKADISLNGVQVDNSKTEINKVAVAVDVSFESIKKAAELKADMLFVHHGLFWGHPLAIRDAHYKRIEALIKNDIALYAAHLPLDAHPLYGNNASIANTLKLINQKPFGEYRGIDIGIVGDTTKGMTVDEITNTLGFNKDNDLLVLPFGKTKNIKRVAIISGGAAEESDLISALEEKADVYITGEHQHILYHTCSELGMTMISGGHYLTETYGQKSIATFLTKHGLDCTFIDIPTGM